MKRTVLALLFLSFAGLLLVNLGSANYFPLPSIEISSPLSSPKIYKAATVPLQVTVNVLTTEPDITSIRYSVDGKANVTLNNLTREDGVSYWTTTKGIFAKGNAFHAESSLDNLAEGKHTLNVYSQDAEGKEMSHSKEFTVDYDYVPPQVPSFTLPNGTAILPVIPPAQTETPMPTTNTGSLQPLENLLTYIIIACVSVSLLAGMLFFKKKSKSWS
jgi:hypothetical protein